MIFDVSLTAAALILILFLLLRFRAYKAQKLRLTDPLKSFFPSHTTDSINTFQQILLFPSNALFDYLVSILTLRKLYDPINVFFADKETLILKGKFKRRVNAAVYKKTKKPDHLVVAYAAKQKTSDSAYKVHGSREGLAFAKKHGVDLFYISYVPAAYVQGARFECVFYLEMNAERVGEDFFGDLFECLGRHRDCGDERFLEVKKRYETNLGSEIMKANIKNSREECREVDEEKRKKRREKRGRVVIKN